MTGTEPVTVPPLLGFGSWIGGDRDGNPFVTPRMTVEALELMRDHCLRLLESGCEQLAGRLSLSERLTGRPTGLTAILARGELEFPELAATLAGLNPEEPYRRALTFMRERIRATHPRSAGAYATPAELLEDLHAVQRSLRAGSGALTAGADLGDFIRQVEVFGFHYARLDIREHARIHRSTLHEIYRRARGLRGLRGPAGGAAPRAAAAPDRRPPSAAAGRHRALLAVRAGDDRDVSDAA